MGYITRLPTAGNANLPTLGSLGYISKQNLKALYIINDGAAPLVDASGNGANLSLVAGSVIPPYSAGVLQFRTANAQTLSTGVAVNGTNQTIIMASKRISVGAGGSQTLFGNLGGTSPATLLDGYPSASQGTVFGQKTASVSAPASTIGVWSVWTAVRNSTQVGLSLNGQAPVTSAYTTADPGTATYGNVAIGPDATTRIVDADVAFFAIYDRALSNAEIASSYTAVKRMLAAKGIGL